MAVTLKFAIDDSANATTYTIKVTVSAVSTNGSWNGDKQSGKLTIGDKTFSFSHSYSSNSTTQLVSKTVSFSKGTSKSTKKIAATFVTGTSSGTIKKEATFTVPALKPLKVTFNGNGGTTTTRTVYYGKTTVFPNSAGTKTGYVLDSWNTWQGGGGTRYGKGVSTPKITKDTTYYAIWTPKNYSITFNGNFDGGTSTTITVPYRQTFTFPSPVRQDYELLGWADKPDAKTATYFPGKVITLTAAEDKTYYAIWELNNVYVSPLINEAYVIRAVNVNNTPEEAFDSPYAYLSFDYKAGLTTGTQTPSYNSTITVSYNNSVIKTFSNVTSAQGSYDFWLEDNNELIEFDIESSHIITVTIVDNNHASGGQDEDTGGEGVASNTTELSLSLPKGGHIIEIDKRGQTISLFGLIEDNKPGLFINNRALGDWIQPVDSVYVGQDKTDPSKIFGFGTWKLYDQGFADLSTTDIGFTIAKSNTTNRLTNVKIAVGRSGHMVWLRFYATNNVAFSGNTDTQLGTFNMKDLGIDVNQTTQKMAWYQYFDGAAEGNDPGALVHFTLGNYGELYTRIMANNSSGNTNIIKNATLRFAHTFYVSTNNMLDDACDKFYWRRIS